MSAANGEGATGGAAPKGGDKKDDTIVKVTAVAIATGIAFSLYKSFFVGRKKEEPVGVSEPFNEQKFEAGAKDKAGQFKAGAKDFKGDVAEKGREAKEWIAGGEAKVKGGLDEGVEAASEKGSEAKETGFNWFGWFGKQADEEKQDVAEKGREAKEWVAGGEAKVKGGLDEGVEAASEKGSEAKETGFNWFGWFGKQADKEKDEAEKAKESFKGALDDSKKSVEAKEKGFFDKAGAQLNKDKNEVTKALTTAEANVEKAGITTVHKLANVGKSKQKPAWKLYGIQGGDTLWGIARKYGVSVEDLKAANGIWNADFIVAGDTLNIPK